MVEPERPQMTIQRMRDACWMSKATRTQVHVYAFAHPRTHARAHAQKYHSYCFSTATIFP